MCSIVLLCPIWLHEGIYTYLLHCLLITVENTTSLINLSKHDEENVKLGDISIDIASIAEEDAISV